MPGRPSNYTAAPLSPLCPNCNNASNMVLADENLTQRVWHCRNCLLQTPQTTGVGHFYKGIRFVAAVALAVSGLPIDLDI